MAVNSGRRNVLERAFWAVAAVLVSSFATQESAPLLIPPAHAIDKAEAAKGPPFHVPVFVSSRSDVCYDPGDVSAIKKLTLEEAGRINARGGVSGRPIAIKFFDDKREDANTISNVRAALSDGQVLAMIGVSNATRGKALFDAAGGEILKSGVPFITDLSVSSLFAAYPNVYTTRASQETDSVPVIVQFTKQQGFARPAFVALKDAVASSELGAGLKATLGEGGLVVDARIGTADDKPIAAELTNALNLIREARPDLVFLYIGGNSNVPDFMKELKASGVTPALFIGGRIDSLPPEVANTYPNAIYSLAWDRPPEVYNDRLRTRVNKDAAAYMFEGAKIPSAPGWANGECKPRELEEIADPFKRANLRAISVGSQFADMVKLVAEAARTADGTTDVVKLRAAVLQGLKSSYAAGRGAFQGSFDNWSFVPATRTAARDPFIIILPQGLGRTQLAQQQFVRTKDGSLRQISTLYADIDLIKAHRVDENAKSFYAEFYLSMRDNPSASIDRIEFANAYLDAASERGRQLTIETVHPGGQSQAYPDSMKIYKISGRFLFDPVLENYPFDMQRFAIDLQPKNGEAPFIVQPPALQLRDQNVLTDGWLPKAQYVGYDEDFVPVVDAFTHAPSVVPFYKARFAWLMQREATDYFLRVVVPLGFILFVAYLSIFIPRTHFEAIVTIQVTALLSAVALYLSLPGLDSDIATLSDRAFVFAYMILSIMIGISILRIMPVIQRRTVVDGVLTAMHVLAIPAFVGLAGYYVYLLSQLS
ncbi:MAG: ABC transporter substrate-binding protein [Hyphomicrobium sp.]|nr:ABC transporter substrate-binding protein [Hyphomicrobium sp.]